MQCLGVYSFTMTPNDAVEWLRRDQCLSMYTFTSSKNSSDHANHGVEWLR